MLISRKLILLLGALCLLGAYPRATSAGPRPALVIQMRLDRAVMEIGDPLWLEVAVTNISSRDFPAPNLYLGGKGSKEFLMRGLLRPAVFDSEGRQIRFGFRVDNAAPLKLEEIIVWLKPGQTIRSRVDISGLWTFCQRPGDYAIAVPLMYAGAGLVRQLQPYAVSNTCFITVVPKGRLFGGGRDPKAPSRLSVRFQVDGRRAWSRHLPATIKGQTYVPAEVAAKLLRARIENTNGRITLKRDGQTLAFLTREQTVVLPSGKRLTDLGLVMAGKQVMLPQKALEQAFGPMTGLTWGIRPKS